MYEKECDQQFLDPKAECFFFFCDYGAEVNLSESIQIQGKLWKVRGIVGKQEKIFYTHGNYYQVKNNEVILFEDSIVHEASIVVLEILSQDPEDLNIELSYMGQASIQQLKSFTDQRKGDRHPLSAPARHNPRKGDRHQ